jgi:hypothetical protein
VAKVKKGTGVTGERNIKSKAARKGETVPRDGRKKAKGKASVVRRGTKAKRVGARKTAKPRKAATRTAKSAGAAGVKRSKGVKSAIGKRARSAKQKRALTLLRGRRAATEAPVVRVAVKPLDPLRKCGPNTTVQFLYRVDETVDGRSTAHLVFFDRHGWYCEHGRTCPAVGYAKKYNGQIARVS